VCSDHSVAEGSDGVKNGRGRLLAALKEVRTVTPLEPWAAEADARRPLIRREPDLFLRKFSSVPAVGAMRPCILGAGATAVSQPPLARIGIPHEEGTPTE
jgi:hypothetical protein